MLPALLNVAGQDVVAAIRDARLGIAAMLNDTDANVDNALEGLPASRREVQGVVSSSNSFQAARFQYELASEKDRNDALTARNAQLESSLNTVIVKVNSLTPVSPIAPLIYGKDECRPHRCIVPGDC